MLISVANLIRIWNVNPKGILHVGAHKGEESAAYKSKGWSPVIWVEANPELVAPLSEIIDTSNDRIINCAAWDKSGEVLDFHVMSDTQSSSLLALAEHATEYPRIREDKLIRVTTMRLDEVLTERDSFDFANFDIQGAEGKAIRGLGERIGSVRFIYTEVNRRELYKGCTRVAELDELLGNIGFKRATTRWILRKGWGDALYIRKDQPPKDLEQHVLAKLSWLRFYSRQLVTITADIIRHTSRMIFKSSTH
jgi:FkbM family methyltransferase